MDDRLHQRLLLPKVLSTTITANSEVHIPIRAGIVRISADSIHVGTWRT
jgi:hypothetical protein